MHPLKIFFFLNERTPYHDILLENLAQDNSVDVKAFFAKGKSEHRPWEFSRNRVNYFYCTSWKHYVGIFLRQVMQDRHLFVIIGGYNESKLLISYFIMKFLRINFAMWTDVPRLNIKRPLIKKIVRSCFLKWLFQNARAIFTMGQPGIEAFKHLGCPEDKIRNLPCTVDLDAPWRLSIEDREKGAVLRGQFAPQGGPILLCAGRLSPEKGFEVAIRAFAEYLTEDSKRQAVLLLAGDGPQKKELEEVSNNFGLTGKVHFLGWMQPEDMKALYYIADALLHPARWEPFGVVILEAMVWGLPVLASNQTMAAVDRINSGENGFIHRVGEVEELAGQMRYVLDNRQKLSDMGKKARLKAEEWPVSRCVQTIIDIASEPYSG